MYLLRNIAPFVWLVISVDLFVVVKIVFPLSVLSGDVNGVVLSFFDVELSADVAVILCEVDELSKDSVASVFFGVDEFPGEIVVVFSDDGVVILNTAPYNRHCSISSGLYGNIHCMPSGKSVKVHNSAKRNQRSTCICFGHFRLSTC